MLSPKIWALLDGPTVTDELVKDPLTKIGDIEKMSYRNPNPIGESKLDDLERAARTFPTRPSDLFLKIYLEALCPLEIHPLAGLVSPSLMGSSGVIPLSICSVIPDIIRHMADVIIHAEKEIFLATNYWEASSAAMVISDAFRELSKRVGERGGEKVIVKLMYDRGNLKQLIENHQPVPPEIYTGKEVQLPAPDEIPNVDLEVQNYHRPVLGTFHAKYMVVDRKIAILNSNNVQDRVNVEFMTHLEGPIVDSLFDMALLSWHKALHPPFPSLISRPTPQTHFDFGDQHKLIQTKGLYPMSVIDTRTSVSQQSQELAEEDTSSVNREESARKLIAEQENVSGTSGDITGPNLKLENGGPRAGRIPMAAVTEHLNTTLQPDTVGDEADDEDTPEFRPHIVHSKHNPVPMALVNRRPRGTPGHSGTVNPQDQAWLAAFKHAQRKIFIQTPTFNAKPVVDATMAAVRRGIECILYLDLGFNDAGERLPMQGGTNEMVVAKMYKELEAEYKDNLKVYWYTGKDQTRPLNASAKKRNCHVKIMMIDDQVGIQGNGNQDSQSWFHSQEINVLVDSKTIIKEWQAGLDANQNTIRRGRVDDDGVWRDADGCPLVDTSGSHSGVLASLKGIGGAIGRLRGKGGF